MKALLYLLPEQPLLLLIPVAAGVAFAFYKWEQARSKALRAAGARLGLVPTEETLDDLPGGLRAMALFSSGSSPAAANVMWGEKRDYVFFEYTYTVGSGKNSSTYTQTVGAFRCAGRNMPDFTAAPEDLGDWFSELFGGQDIDFQHDPVFSKKYRLRGKDEAAIRDFFSVGGTQYLAARPGWTVHALGEWLLAYRSGKQVGHKKLKDFVWDLQGLYGALLGI